MRRSFILLAAGILLMASGAGPLRGRQYQPDPRQTWVYLWVAPQTGSFQEVGNRLWVERNPAVMNRYQESMRTPQYVELYDAERDVTVRLFAKQMYYDLASSTKAGPPKWKIGYVGSWR